MDQPETVITVASNHLRDATTRLPLLWLLYLAAVQRRLGAGTAGTRGPRPTAYRAFPDYLVQVQQEWSIAYHQLAERPGRTEQLRGLCAIAPELLAC